MLTFALRLSAVVILATACEPIGPIPGGRLDGELAEQPVRDWSFANGFDTIEIETRPGDPHSVTVWCVAWGDALYIPTRDPESKHWVNNVVADPRVRVRVDGVLYEGRAVRVTDEQELAGAVPALLEKYDIELEPGEETNAWLFRIESPGVPAQDSEPATGSTAGTWIDRSG